MRLVSHLPVAAAMLPMTAAFPLCLWNRKPLNAVSRASQAVPVEAWKTGALSGADSGGSAPGMSEESQDVLRTEARGQPWNA